MNKLKKDPFLRKIQELRCRYGDREAEHFKTHPYCENKKCGEKRIAALTVHHVHGVKNSDEVRTLCFNCHMIHHAPVAGNFTYEDHLVRVKDRQGFLESRKEFHLKLVKAWEECGNLRKVGRDFGISHNAVRNAVLKYRGDQYVTFDQRQHGRHQNSIIRGT